MTTHINPFAVEVRFSRPGAAPGRVQLSLSLNPKVHRLHGPVGDREFKTIRPRDMAETVSRAAQVADILNVQNGTKHVSTHHATPARAHVFFTIQGQVIKLCPDWIERIEADLRESTATGYDRNCPGLEVFLERLLESKNPVAERDAIILKISQDLDDTAVEY